MIPNGLLHNTKRCLTLFGHHNATKIKKCFFQKAIAERGFQHHSIYMHALNLSLFIKRARLRIQLCLFEGKKLFDLYYL